VLLKGLFQFGKGEKILQRKQKKCKILLYKLITLLRPRNRDLGMVISILSTSGWLRIVCRELLV